MTAKRTAFVPAVVSRCRIPGHQGIRFSQVDAGGFSPVGELAPTGRQAQSARPSARTPFCKLAFDVALEAKNSLSVSAMAANRRPLALFLNLTCGNYIMIHYHGLPITPASAARAAVSGGHAFVSFRYPDQLGLVLDVCQSFAVDNGAFSAWKSGEPVTDWSRYYEWVAELHRYPSFDFAVIPDVIDGDEQANDALLAEWPWRGTAKGGSIGAPVWHMHESIDQRRPRQLTIL